MTTMRAIVGTRRWRAGGLSARWCCSSGVIWASRRRTSSAAVAVRIAAGDIGLSAPDVETAVYLCCIESIQNAGKHGGPDTSVTVRLRREGDELASPDEPDHHGDVGFAEREPRRRSHALVQPPGEDVSDVERRRLLELRVAIGRSSQPPGGD
jgi:hypothetical protein